jgi:hypothetical protein
MGHSTTTAASAGRALRLLAHPDLKQPPTLGPQTRRATPTTAPAPLNIGLLDHLTSTVSEVEHHARAVAPDAGPLPEDLGDLYDWYIDATGDATLEDQALRDALIETHRLRHAIRLGDRDAVRPHPCPACGSWGLFLDSRGIRAQCSNTDCRTPDGMASSWSLSRLAAQKVRRTEIWRRNAT